MNKYYDITPCSKPRMTRRDKHKTRPVFARYWAFKEECQLKKVHVPERGSHVVFRVPMAKSWSKKKKAEMLGRPHQQTPDVDNFLKGLLDAIYADDSHIHDIRVSKVWDYNGGIEVIET